VTPQIQLTDLGSAVSFSQRRRRTFVATRHVVWAPSTKRVCSRASTTNAFFVYLEHRKCVLWLQMAAFGYPNFTFHFYVFRLNEILKNKLKQMWLLRNVLYPIPV